MNKIKDNLQIAKYNINFIYIVRLSRHQKLITIWNFLNRLIPAQVRSENIRELQAYNDALFLKYKIDRRIR